LPAAALSNTPSPLIYEGVSPTGSTVISGITMNTTYYVRYTDPMTGCSTVAPVDIVVDNSLCILPCPDPSFTCNANILLCAGDVALDALDLGTNGTAETDGSWSGTGAALINDQGTAAVADDVIDPTLGIDGTTYTLTLTMEFNGCSESFDCTFTFSTDCDADAGRF